jgi:hypothetical protein
MRCSRCVAASVRNDHRLMAASWAPLRAPRADRGARTQAHAAQIIRANLAKFSRQQRTLLVNVRGQAVGNARRDVIAIRAMYGIVRSAVMRTRFDLI